MTPALRQRSLAALRRVLTAQQAALFAAASPGGSSSEAAGGGTVCLPEVAAAAWRLAVLSSELADAELAVRRGWCKGCLGALPVLGKPRMFSAPERTCPANPPSRASHSEPELCPIAPPRIPL